MASRIYASIGTHTEIEIASRAAADRVAPALDECCRVMESLVRAATDPRALAELEKRLEVQP